MKKRIKRATKVVRSMTLSPYEQGLVLVSGCTLPTTLLALIWQVRKTHIDQQPANIRLYVITAIIFVIVALIAIFFATKNKKIRHLSLILCGIATVLGGLHLYGLWDCYRDSTHIYPYLSYDWFFWRRIIPNKLMFFLMIGMAILGNLFVFYSKKFLPQSKFFFYGYAVIVSFFGGVGLYFPNFYLNDIHHGNAYFASVYNLMQGSAYTEICRSIYGHYAIFLQYPVKFLGGTYQAFNFVMVLLGMIVFLLIALVLRKYIQNRGLQLVAVGALPFIAYLLPQNRWQIFPHRFLFPAIILFIISKYIRRESRGLEVAGYIISAVAVCWNLESGVVCALVWALTLTVRRLTLTHPEQFKRIPFFFLIRQVIYVLLSLVGGYGIFEIFNLIRSGEIAGVDEFLFPLILPALNTQIVKTETEQNTVVEIVERVEKSSGAVNDYFMDLLSVLLPYENSFWYYVFCLFGLAVVVFLTAYFFRQAKEKHMLLFLTAVMAYGQLVYFVNRPDYSNLGICYLDAVIVLSLFADQRGEIKEFSDKKKYPVHLFFTGILSLLLVFSLALGIQRIVTRQQEGNYDLQAFQRLTREMKQAVPEGVPAFGSGIQEIYAQMERDTIWHLTDMNDTTTSEHYFIFSHIQDVKECVISIRNKTTKEDYTVEDFVDAWILDGTRPFELVYQADMGQQSVWDWNVYYIRFLD